MASYEGWSCGHITFTPPLTARHVGKLWQSCGLYCGISIIRQQNQMLGLLCRSRKQKIIIKQAENIRRQAILQTK